MSLHVQRKVIAASKAPLTDHALEGLGTCVLSVVPRQFVGPGEPPLTLGPLTRVRLLTCKKKR